MTTSEDEKTLHTWRVALVLGSIAVWSLLVLARLAQLQVFQHREFAQLALQRQQVTRQVLAPRGIIYDSAMAELATAITVSTVVAEPRRMRDVPGASASLAGILKLDGGELLKRLSDPSRQVFRVVKRRIDPKDEARIAELGIEGVYFVDESMRVYPNRDLASHVLGFVNMNGDGGAGIELQYDRELRGTQGLISFVVDARRRSFRGRVEKPPIQGHALVLSIDQAIQYAAERELAAGVEKAKAAAGIAIVMESDTGRILALAGYPDFNCNSYNNYTADYWRNRALSDLFEPGSTFKVVVATSALEAGLARPTELIDCQMGSIRFGNHIFHDHKPYGLLTFNQVLEHSSNVGAAKLGLRLGEERLYEGLRNFGFGSKTEIDLPGELVGLVRHWTRWSGLSIGAISFGQEIGVTPLQMLVGINSIASGGYRVRPYLVDRVIDHAGDLVRTTLPQRIPIIRPETAAAITEAFEGVVLRGTGRGAALEGYRAAGKTGTAQKIVDGRYSHSKYVASFIGFAPLPKARVTILVQIDEPKGAIYGGAVAAPIFREIAQQALLRLKVPPDQSHRLAQPNPALAAIDSGDFLPNATPIVPRWEEEGRGAAEPGGFIARPVRAETVVMPDFTGMPKRQVIAQCQDLKIQVQTSGSGLAVFQLPPAGAAIPIGETCSVTFGRGRISDFRRVPGVEPREVAVSPDRR